MGRSDAPRDDARRARLSGWADDVATAEAPLSAPATSTRNEVFLVVRRGEDARIIPLSDPAEHVVGRSEEADIQIDDHVVSRRHAMLRLRRGVLSIEDLGGRNGTLVNGQRVSGRTVTLLPGDSAAVGGTQLMVVTRGEQAVASATTPNEVVVADPALQRTYESAQKVAGMPTTVLILGETGTGKDVLARWIHAQSPRRARPFMRIECAGIPDSLLESTLFGHERGAFTGADRRRVGLFEAAAGGTVFLDEIGELSESTQVKLLGVLENRAITPLGKTEPVAIDVRVIAATHRDLQAMVAEGRFRADLYYRLCTFVLDVPPLRERPADVERLARSFLERFAAELRIAPPPISPDALARLRAHDWPGNVRELRNAIERAFVLADGRPLTAHHFDLESVAPSAPSPIERGLGQPGGQPDRAALDDVRGRHRDAERRLIEEAIALEGGNQTRAAARLGMPRRTLVYKLAGYRRDDATARAGTPSLEPDDD